jgi:hypothetical protein
MDLSLINMLALSSSIHITLIACYWKLSFCTIYNFSCGLRWVSESRATSICKFCSCLLSSQHYLQMPFTLNAMILNGLWTLAAILLHEVKYHYYNDDNFFFFWYSFTELSHDLSHCNFICIWMVYIIECVNKVKT